MLNTSLLSTTSARSLSLPETNYLTATQRFGQKDTLTVGNSHSELSLKNIGVLSEIKDTIIPEVGNTRANAGDLEARLQACHEEVPLYETQASVEKTAWRR